MTDEQILILVDEMVEKRIELRKYPSHVLRLDFLNTAKKLYPDSNREEIRKKVRKLIKERKIFAGRTVNDIWISTQKNNIYENKI